MSAPGRRGASIFTQGPAPAGSARGAPIPANEDERRRFPTWSLCPQLRLHEEKQRLQSRAAQPLPFRPSGDRGPAGLEGSLEPRRRVPAAALPPPRPPANCRTGLPARRRSGSAGYLRGAAPLFVERRARDLLPRPRLRPAFRLPPAAPGPAAPPPPPPPAAAHVLSLRLRRVPSPPPPPPHHVPHPGLRHRETRSRPAWVGAQRPARARRPRGQSAALRPARDTTLSRPGRRAPSPGASLRARAPLPIREC